MTRTEAFLHFVHDHPEEALASTEDAIADDVRRLEAEEWAQQADYEQREAESEYSDAA